MDLSYLKRWPPRRLTCQKEFLLFYMCQLWALHVVTKRQFLHLFLQFFY